MSDKIKEKTVKEYIGSCPKQARSNLNAIRAEIKKAAPNAKERMDYFDMPGYSYDNGYDYDGMFVWFSYKIPFVRLHVRPPTLEEFAQDVAKYKTTKSVISFSEKDKLPLGLIKKLVKRSLSIMKAKKLD